MQSNLTGAIEAFLHGYCRSGLRKLALVRGSYVNGHWMGKYRRLCRDLDLLYLESYDVSIIIAHVKKALLLAEDSIVIFDIDKLSYKEIWQNSISPGVRVFVPFSAKDGTENNLQIDIAANDPLIVPPIEFDVPDSKFPLIVKTVPIEVSIAWKLHGLFEHLNGAWMSKTLWDLYVLCRYNDIDKALLLSAIHLAFSSRLDPIEVTKRFLFGDFGQSKSSRKNWAKEIGQLSSQENPSLNDILFWLRGFFSDLMLIENDGSLLTHSEVITFRVKQLRLVNTAEAKAKLKTLNRKTKILPAKAYHSIPHLPGSRTGPSDKTIDANKSRMLTQQQLKESDKVIVQEKLDGSCVCAYRRGDEVLALGREGDLASESPNTSRQLWSEWVELQQSRFLELLMEGERVCGEWLALAHGTRYKVTKDPFIAFDLFDVRNRQITQAELIRRCEAVGINTPFIVHEGLPCSIEEGLARLGNGGHEAIDPPEGLVWRLERNDKVLFTGKYVRSGKKDGLFLPENSGLPEIWNWHP